MVSVAPAVNRLHGRGRILIAAIPILKLLDASSDNRGAGVAAPTPRPTVWSPERPSSYNRNV